MDSPELEEVVSVLRAGGVLVYPTETFYGLGASVESPEGVRKLVRLKVRPPEKPIAVLVSGFEMVERVADRFSAAARRLAERFWPGPLTLVLPARPHVSPLLTAGSGTIGVRWSSHALATSIVEALGAPLTTPSANPSGEPPPVRIEEARAYFGEAVDRYVDGGTLAGGSPSTVVDPGPPLRILRPGAVAEEALREAAEGSG
ncbi:MAG: hypothetical protein KatS3mg076_2292 [Candidatus Binatia bacterium]|nr:MAG: hypothetical protein KatS3mg076_2292 [Candidatus Binatia bacterium]